MASNGRTSTWRRGHCKSRGKSGQQPLGIPLSKRRPDLAGQRPPQAPRGAEAGRAAPGPVPRPAPPWCSRTGWTSRRSRVCWATTRRGLRWTPTPTSPPGPSGRQRTPWGRSWRGLTENREKKRGTGAVSRARAPYGSKSGSPPCPQNGDCPGINCTHKVDTRK